MSTSDSQAADERATQLPAGWSLAIRENWEESWLVLSGPDGSICAFKAERGSVRAQVMQNFLTAKAGVVQ